tara:strand:- start:65 stop:262 length:198 start_codon:yes stop_codon:yes gene_type:complete
MQITKFSPQSMRDNTREIDVTQSQLDRWKAGELIQNVMPHLSPDDREFLMTGLTPEDWEEMFPDI